MGFTLHTLGLCAVALVCHAISIPRHATLASRETANQTQYDFIVAGGGLTGLTVADRLSENPSGKSHHLQSSPNPSIAADWVMVFQ